MFAEVEFICGKNSKSLLVERITGDGNTHNRIDKCEFEKDRT